MAIVVGGKVAMAPVIRDPITGGSVLITAPDDFLDLLAEGGSGYHFLGRSAQKVVLVRRPVAGAQAA
jgi:hypothetical protein